MVIGVISCGVTGRLPFDPSRMKGKRTGERAGDGGNMPPESVLPMNKNPADHGAITVSALASKIDHALKNGLPDRFVVVGEISSLAHRTHYYFSLKDDQAVISAVVFASSARKMGYTPIHGDSVIARGRVEYYAPGGRISLIVTSMMPVGEGGLQRRYKELCDTLRNRGWFDPSQKHELPSFPRRIAVVTSKDGAAVQDVINTLGKRCPCIEIVIVDVRVQGERAVSEIVRAISMLNHRAGELCIDAILLTRGGGSLEDLWAFNEIKVAEAIHESELPIVAAIGHETDTTIAELVADQRCATPTQAAMVLSPDREALEEQLSSVVDRLQRAVGSELRYLRQRLEALTSSRSMSDPREIISVHRDRLSASCDRLLLSARDKIGNQRAQLDRVAIKLARLQPSSVHARREEHLRMVHQRLERVMTRSISRRKDELVSISRELHAIGPAQVLSRGFSVTSRPDGSLVRSIAEVKNGEALVTTLMDGKVHSLVQSPQNGKAKGEPDSPDPRLKPKIAAPLRRSSKAKPTDRDQLDLFR
jgi:exodeoxyribonuclease VII large subunit